MVWGREKFVACVVVQVRSLATVPTEPCWLLDKGCNIINIVMILATYLLVQVY
jgi:hypothetical protein